MRHIILLLSFVLIGLSMTSKVLATDIGPASTEGPIEITADKALSWDQQQKEYVATGSVVARQGDMTLKAEEMRAQYDNAEEKNRTVLNTLTASGGAILTTPDHTLIGNKMRLDMAQQKASVAGGNPTLKSRNITITAQDRMEFWIDENRARAIGRARVVQGDDAIESDDIEAWFTEDKNTGNRVLERAVANGNVIITSQNEKAQGDRAIYTRTENIAQLEGNVIITRGKNVLTGDRAEIDLSTRISSLVSDSPSPQRQGRVRAVFYPDSIPQNNAAESTAGQ